MGSLCWMYMEGGEEVRGRGRGREGGGRGGGGGGGGGGAAIETAPDEGSIATWEEGIMLASLSLYLSISPLTALSSACKDCTCCCKAEIAPMHPYTGSLSLTLAS